MGAIVEGFITLHIGKIKILYNPPTFLIMLSSVVIPYCGLTVNVLVCIETAAN